MMKKFCIILAIVLCASSYLLAQDDACIQVINDGKAKFNSGKYYEAIKFFEAARKIYCTDAQSWINKCNERIDLIPPSKTPCIQLWKSGEDAFSKEDYAEAIIRFKEFEAKKCTNEKLKDYLQICEENIFCATLWKLGEDAYKEKDYSMAIIWFKEFEAKKCTKSELQKSLLQVYLEDCVPPTLELSQTNREFDAAGDKFEISVATNKKSWSFNKEDTVTWFSLSQKDSVLTIVCKPNETTEDRKATFTVEVIAKAGKIVKHVFITQAAMPDWNKIHELIKSIMLHKDATHTSSGDYISEQKDRLCGLGLYRWKKEEDFYAGEWKKNDTDKGARWGKGIFIVENEISKQQNLNGCAVYAGDWEKSYKQGLGRCYNKYGKLIYEGNFQDDEPTDDYSSTNNNETRSFEVIYHNGYYYVGEMLNGNEDGLGLFVYDNGDIFYGTFQKGICKGEGIEIKDGKISRLGTWNGGRYTPIEKCKPQR